MKKICYLSTAFLLSCVLTTLVVSYPKLTEASLLLYNMEALSSMVEDVDNSPRYLYFNQDFEEHKNVQVYDEEGNILISMPSEVIHTIKCREKNPAGLWTCYLEDHVHLEEFDYKTKTYMCPNTWMFKKSSLAQ